jgi:superfamily I DNA and/or RNA helicase
LAIAAAKTREFYDKRAKERQKRKPADSVPENLPEQNGDSRDEAGKAFGVSGRLVDYASKVLKKGTPELIRAVEQNQIAVSTAAVLAEKLRPVIASVRLPAW